MEIICGRQGTGKTDQVFKRIKALPKTCSIYLIVPEQATYETECALLDALGADGAIHIRVTGLMRFVRGLAHATPLNAHTVMTDDAKNLAVKSIIDTLASSLETYRRSADKKGFADDAVRLIGELKEARVTLADLQRAAGGADGALGAKLSDVAAIYTRYEETASDGRLDPDDFMAAAAEYVCGMKDIGASYFFFDSFHTFDASSYPLITQLIRCAADVCFTLTTGEGDFFEITRSTLEKLTQAAADAAKPVRTTYLTGKKDSADALCFLEENLPRYATKRFENPNGAVCLREYDSIEEEAAGVAADICAYVRENGARYSDIGVAVSDLAVYGPVVEAVFKRYGIPVYIDSRKSVAYFAPVRALLLMLKMAQKPFSTEDIIAFAKTGFAPVGYRECEDIENYCLQYAVSGRRWHGDFTFDPERDYDLAYINGIRARLTACTDAFAEEYAAQKTVGGQCRTAYGFVESHLSEKIAQSAQQDEDAANTYVQVYNKMLDIIECAYGLFEDTPADQVDLASVLQYAFMCADIGTIPATIDTVSVGDIMRSRAPQVEAMFVLGVSEGAVPAMPRPGNIFTDSDKSQLKKSGVHLQNDTGYIIRKENFIFYTLLSRPKKHLGVSAVRSGEGTRSFLFERLVTMFGLNDAPDDVLHGIVNDETAYDFISGRYGEKDSGSLEAAVCDYFENNCAQPHYADTLKAAAAFTNEAVLHSAKYYDKLLGKNARLSVSKLEKYAQCPFGFYTGYILKPVQRKRYQIRRLDIGIVVHAVMEAFSQKLFSAGAPAPDMREDEIAALADELTRQTLERYATGVFSELAKSRYQTAKIARVARDVIRETLRQLRLSDFRLTEAESAFANVAVEIEGAGRILLEGKIDRIDAYEANGEKYIKIIDYKTGGAKVDMAMIEAGIDLQLPVYIGIAAAKYGALPAGFFYVRIRPDPVAIEDTAALDAAARKVRSRFALCGISLNDVTVLGALDKSGPEDSFISDLYAQGGAVNKSAVLSAEEFDALIETADTHIRRLSRDIIDAKIGITPYRSGNKNACKICEYGDICKFSESFGANAYRAVGKQAAREEPV